MHYCEEVRSINNTIKKEADKSVIGFLKYLSCNPHKNFPRIIEVGEDYYIEERINGQSLEEIVAENFLGEETAKEYMLQLCDSVELLHKNGIIHRDIKPANIMVSTFGVVKLIDYDIARTKKGESTEKDTTILGTVGYAPPEQYGFTQTDERSDIYSMGVVYNYMLTGTIPQKKTAKGKVGDIIKHCTSLAPWERYESISALREDIQKEKKKETTTFDRITAYIPGMRSKNIFKLAIAIMFYLAVIISQAEYVKELFDKATKMDTWYLMALAIWSYGYIFLFFAFLTNWANIADRFFPKVEPPVMKRITGAVILFAATSLAIGWTLEVNGETFLSWNPVVFLFTRMWESGCNAFNMLF